MFYGYFGCALCLVAIFCIPADLGATAQYAWFFIAYTLLNAGFYTANNIAYSALTALITKNNHERVQMGSIRFMFAFGTSMLIQTITVGLVAHFGGGRLADRRHHLCNCRRDHQLALGVFRERAVSGRTD